MPITLSGLKKNMLSELSSLYCKYESEAIFKVLIEHVLGYRPIDIAFNRNSEIKADKLNQLNTILLRLKQAEPIQYITGYTTFYDLKIEVEPSVLIPRQETEILVDYLINKYKAKGKIKILDIGTGSGCIAIALKKNLPDTIIHAVDVSKKALKIAKRNALIHGLEINFSHIDILNPNTTILGEFDLVISNPPYVRQSEKAFMHKNVVRYEPALALYVEDEEPLIFYKAILKYCELVLKHPGQVIFEINESFGNQLLILLEKNGFNKIKLIKDFNQKYRFIKGEKI
jgi:release factor glutamine methyltransferase